MSISAWNNNCHYSYATWVFKNECIEWEARSLMLVKSFKNRWCNPKIILHLLEFVFNWLTFFCLYKLGGWQTFFPRTVWGGLKSRSVFSLCMSKQLRERLNGTERIVLDPPLIFRLHFLFSLVAFGGRGARGGPSFNAPLKGYSWKSEQEHFLTTSQSP